MAQVAVFKGEVAKRLARVKKGTRHVHLSYCAISDTTFPKEVFELKHLTRLDLGYNNIQYLDPAIGKLVGLTELWLNDNPLTAVPVSVSLLKKLDTLDLRNTYVGNIPREFATLSRLQDLNLGGCPLKPSLRRAYGEGRHSLFEYLRRKNDRRTFKRELNRMFREDIYPFDPPESHLQLVDQIFLQLKDKTSEDLRKLIRHAARILPDKIQNVEVSKVRMQIENLVEEDKQMQEIGTLQLRLRGSYPEVPLELAAEIAAGIYREFTPQEMRRLWRDQALLFPKSWEGLSAEMLRENMEELKDRRYQERITKRIVLVYPEASPEELEMIYQHCLLSCESDKQLLDRALERALPAELAEAITQVEEELPFEMVWEEEPKEESNAFDETEAALQEGEDEGGEPAEQPTG